MKNMQRINDKIGRIYHYTIGRFIEVASLYKLDLEKYHIDNVCDIDNRYQFQILSDFDDRLVEHYALVPGKIDRVLERFDSGNYTCFAYVDTKMNSISYTRWICKNQFRSDTLDQTLVFKENEVLTLDSYTPPKNRGQGLHKAMNYAMLNWLKQETDYNTVYMVIKDFIPHLAKYPKKIGYKKEYTRHHYKKGSIRAISKVIAQKISGK